jgi:PLP dependent protein
MTETTLNDSSMDFSYLDENYKRIKDNIEKAALSVGRNPDEVTFMAVTKTVSPQPINHVLSLGVRLIGENKVQELLSKLEFLNTDGVDMHIIGHLQSNKVRKIADIVSMVQSVDSVELAEEIAKRSLAVNRTMDVLLEVNIGCEFSKTGFSLEEIKERACEINEIENVNVRGLMAIPPVCEGEEVRRYFADMKKLHTDIKSLLNNKADFDVLSLGMSADYAEAVKEGSTLVRVGSSLFGARRY